MQLLDLRALTTYALVLVPMDFVYGILIWDRLNDTQIELLSFNGIYGWFDYPDWVWYGGFGLQIAILTFLRLGFSWARPAFLLFMVWFVVSTLPFGVGISMPSQMFLGTLKCLLFGAITFVLIGSTAPGTVKNSDTVPDK